MKPTFVSRISPHEDIELKFTQTCIGTPPYIAPEVLKSRKYDTKADIYSLGIIVEEMFNFNDEP